MKLTFMRSKGTNLVSQNPYLQKTVAIRNLKNLTEEVLRLCAEKGQDLNGLKQLFKKMDRNGNGSVDPIEFKYSMRDFGLDLSEIEVSQLVKHFDANHDGKISVEEFINAIQA